MPYQLKGGVYLVEGASRGALLDTNSGLVYSVNGTACQIVNYHIENDTYWTQLVQMGIAETSVFPTTSAIQPLKDAERLKFVWFEVVTDDCNETNVASTAMRVLCHEHIVKRWVWGIPYFQNLLLNLIVRRWYMLIGYS